MVSFPEPSADFSKNRLLRIVVLVINIVIFILGFVLLVGAAALAIRTDANGQILVFAALLGAGFFVVSSLGIAGITKYDLLLFIYFVATLFFACISLFLTVYIIVNLEDIRGSFESDLQANWASVYEDLGTDIQGQIVNVFEGLGYISCDDVTYLACCSAEDIAADSCTVTWAESCIDVPTLPAECYDEAEEFVSQNLTIVLVCVATLVFLTCLPLILVLKIMGFHEIVKHSQLIVTVCLGIFSFLVIVAGAVMAGYLAAAGISSIAGLGYVVLAVGVVLFIVSGITYVGHTKGNKALQTVSTILFGLLALIFVLLFIFCFAFQTNVAQYFATDCSESCTQQDVVASCWITTLAEDDSCDLSSCDGIESCAQYIYYQSNLEVLEDLSSRYSGCNADIQDIKNAINSNTAVVTFNATSAEQEECDLFANAYESASAFYDDDYETWSDNIISYLDTTGYACALAFIFCIVQLGASYYVSQTDSELQ